MPDLWPPCRVRRLLQELRRFTVTEATSLDTEMAVDLEILRVERVF